MTSVISPVPQPVALELLVDHYHARPPPAGAHRVQQLGGGPARPTLGEQGMGQGGRCSPRRAARPRAAPVGRQRADPGSATSSRQRGRQPERVAGEHRAHRPPRR